MELIFATNNQHKVAEMRSVVPEGITIRSLSEAGIIIEIPEPYNSLEENAREKAITIFAMKGMNCFSEDTGLEVNALNNAPGVKSARYAGDNADSGMNIQKLISELDGQENREARFRTVICLIMEGKEFFFEGICQGSILKEKKGEKGFGYDPVFQPTGSDKSFAEMSTEEKNRYSHRAKALAGLVAFLKHNR